MLIIFHPHLQHNKYYHWYTALVERFITQPPSSDYETHHILPKSMGGSNHQSNTVRLPIRHHYVAHLLLWKCTTGASKQKMAYAVTVFRAGRGLTMNSRLFEAARASARTYKSNISAGMFTAVDANGVKHRIHNTDPRFLSGELVAASRGRLAGRKQTPVHRSRLAQSKHAQQNPNHKWIVTTPLGTFNSLGEAASAHNTSRTTVLNRCNSHRFPDWIKTSDT